MKPICKLSLLLPLLLLLPASQNTAMSQTTSLLHAAGPELLPAPAPQHMGSLPDGSTPRASAVTPFQHAAPHSGMVPRASVSPRGLPDYEPAAGLRGVSWTYQQAPPLRQFRVQDIVTIRVDEVSRMQAEGETEKRRNSIFSAVLTDWLKLTRFGLVPDPQADGDPKVASKAQSNFRAEASVESREALTFNVAARVVDIRPNGNLVLEARKKLRHNDNLWETSLSGICRAQDIGPDNVVLSKDMIDLEILKEDRGQIADGYQRGWFQKAMDRIKPF